ncbi:hypothetical protein [Melioribacter sp. OK-6-Me]|uniref:hypothetical protein n=1 Tax=unclassified Melioribacter TaxID=2627329 RepID=UPI003EDAB4F7
MRRIIKNSLVLTFVFFNIITFSQQGSYFVNPLHLDQLYQDIFFMGDSVGIIHIYSEYPEYKWVGDEDEGIACVDDVARAVIFYSEYAQYTGKVEYQLKVERLIKFILNMQSDNGYFYNFIFDDFSINKRHQNSEAIGSWWSWRALWCLTEVVDKIKNKQLTHEIECAIAKTIKNIKKDYNNKRDTVILNGVALPVWLPYEYASDQAALIILSLVNYYKKNNDSKILEIIKSYSDGIVLMQAGSDNMFPYNAFLSWNSSWHAWGNLQAYALLKAYTVLNDKRLLDAALNEIKNFYPYLIEKGYLNEFKIEKKGNLINILEVKRFPQIAYGIRPMIYATVLAGELTGQEYYYELAVKAAMWFIGDNPANTKMYFYDSGICYDGILGPNKVNRNSGAESTIETLLSLNRIISNTKTRSLFNSLLEK